MPPAWPVAALLVGYPIWWALGLGIFSFTIIAIPMAWGLVRRWPIRLPAGFGLWLLFLLWCVFSLSMITVDPPGTYGQFGMGRMISSGLRLVQYLSITILLLYIGNLTEKELPRLRLVRMLGIFFLTTVAGGLLGTYVPDFEFKAPLEYVLPAALANDSYVLNLVHPTAAQIEWFLGFRSPRPEAPFEWANAWGNNLSILLIWFVIGWWTYGGPGRRLSMGVFLSLAAIPVVYSLNRGLWAALGFAVLFGAIRMAMRGRVWALAGMSAILLVGTVFFISSPLKQIVDDRLANPHSDSGRAWNRNKTMEVAWGSPVLGYGGTRWAIGSQNSSVTGKTGGCPECGHPPLGADGQLWLVIISQGYVGAFFYLAFFLNALWRYRRDNTPIGSAGLLVLCLALFTMLIYDHLVTPLALYFVTLGLLWRNDQARRAARFGAALPPAPQHKAVS
ncbi:hypothetical protein DPM19_15235 [Actinomadura craniellae]|uniref:O-antigen ligase domain-containing protein n=1 Tax=Actinomadura craniellae TaxID=2231787 RepID=A0A365H636_9ACTN|nr:hypothetical protein DPM19_15235 [Actinomadura craniellae]